MKKIGPHRLYRGDCLKVLRKLEDNSIDSIVTDPPYGLSFMGRKWDYDVPSVAIWKECLRVLKPGGHLLAFAGTRTQHRMAVNIEDAGFEIRDMIAWCYGSGMPKSLDVSKAIDATLIHGGSGSKQIKKTNLSRPGSGVCRKSTTTNGIMGASSGSKITNNNPETTEALKYAGFGTALKPALEPLTIARKPLIGTVAKNVLKHGTGALNIDGCRVHSGGPKQATAGRRTVSDGKGFGVGQGGSSYVKGTGAVWSNEGRFPANLIHDGSEEVIAAFPDAPGQQGDLKGHAKERQSKNGCFGKMGPAKDHAARVENNKSASRFFYTAKASKQDRDEGNTHPTVKPRMLMRYLVRLVTPPKGICLDPFMGSGTTGVACQYEGFHFVGIEREKEYFSICKMRVRKARRLWRESKNQDTPNTTKDKKCAKKRSEKAKASPKSRLNRKSAKSRQ